MIKRLILVIFLLALAAGVYSYAKTPKPLRPGNTDQGSGEVTLRIGESGAIGDLIIRLNDVVQDNRCPADAICIQMGAIVADVILMRGPAETTVNIAQDDIPYQFVNHEVSIEKVLPYVYSGKSIEKPQYEVTFRARPFTVVSYACSEERRADVMYRGTDAVWITLSDGRQFQLPRKAAASGAKYANEDESFVFWSKGREASITEGTEGDVAYIECKEDNSNH